MDSRRELRLVTCLFVDVVGSTDATVRLGPERMQRLLGEAFDAMSGTIAAHGGTVEKYVGDAIFAVFGAPVSHADDAERALRAADACARWSSASVSGATPTAGVALGVRIGLETGEALVDLSGVAERERMVVGECVNVAARLQQHAEPGEVIVGPTAHEATMHIAAFEPLGALQLKGLGVVDGRRFTGFATDAASREVGFVGRENELRALGDAFRRASDGAAVLALVVGPPGQGKSRLAAEAMRAAGGVRVIEARCRPGTETGLNTPLRQLVEADIPEATSEAVRERVTSVVTADDAAELASAISHSAGLAVDERMIALGRYEQRELIAEAWRQYLGSVARDAPLAVLVEDVHWADPVVLRVIDHLTTNLGAPLVVVATARPEFLGTAGLRPREDRIQIELGPLEPDAVQRLVAVARGEDGDGATPAEVDRAAGNPLFVIELARSRARHTDVPITIQAAIAARLDELSPTDRELLQRTSVVGETFGVRDAALLTERDPGDVAAALGRLTHLGFLVATDAGYRFHHALVRDVAYGRLPVVDRMALHAQYAMEGIDPADVEALAHHWWEALKPPDGEWVWDDARRRSAMRLTAYRAHLAAGQRLESRNAYEDALEVYLRAVELAEGPRDRADAEGAVGRAADRQGRGDDAWTHRLRAIELYRQAGGEPPAALYADMLEIATFNWGYFHELPDDGEVLRLLDEGARVARESRDDVSLARLLGERAAFTTDVTGTEEIDRFVASPDAAAFANAAQRMATVRLWAGSVSDAVSLFETVLDRLVPDGAVINEPEALTWYGLAAFTAGDLARGEAIAARLVEESTRRSVHTKSHAYAVDALMNFGRGDWAALDAVMRGFRSMVESHPETPFCLLGAAAFGYDATAAILAGRPLPDDIDLIAARMADDSEPVQRASVMLPKVMAGDGSALAAGLTGYDPGLRLWDRYRVWDVADLMPAIAFAMVGDWDGVRRRLARLDEFARGGARLAEAAAAAIREEEAGARGGPEPAHEQLRGLGYAGISELLRYGRTFRIGGAEYSAH
ncbi:MAG: AAA family ATPase [Chloroflexota bacterium]|nr:AAA family ATPase [Chloroflexota bacterium]